MKHCSDCGSTQLQVARSREGLARVVTCLGCGARHYSNPKLVVACLAEWQCSVLLCQRAIEPRAGLWSLPGGYVEAGETLQQAAAREAREEALAEIDDLALYRLYNLPRFNEVVAVFRGTLRNGAFGIGEETADARLFPRRALPWDALAFESTRAALNDCATQRWHAAYASPVQDLVWIAPATAVRATRRAATR
jgi:ADP-ribose pyrophosphatase YjhB (NUDIX family)